jgi:hypothetical protein
MPRGVINKNVERSNFQLINRFKWSHFAGPFHRARNSLCARVSAIVHLKQV